jgi:hypothetical protein
MAEMTDLSLDGYPDTRTNPSIELYRFLGGFERELGVGREDEVVFLRDDIPSQGSHGGSDYRMIRLMGVSRTLVSTGDREGKK